LNDIPLPCKEQIKTVGYEPELKKKIEFQLALGTNISQISLTLGKS